MKKAITIFIFIFGVISVSSAQEQIEGQILKDSLYLKYKKEVINYSFKEFDKLFIDFHQITNNKNNLLTEVEFYSYTIKIAAFSDRWAGLYPKEKEQALQNKKEWFEKKYSDYLNKRKTN